MPVRSPYSPVSIKYNLCKGLRLVGATKEPVRTIYQNDPEIEIYKGAVTFRQFIEIAAKGEKEIEIQICYQTCNDVQCLPPAAIKLKVNLSVSRLESHE